MKKFITVLCALIVSLMCCFGTAAYATASTSEIQCKHKWTEWKKASDLSPIELLIVEVSDVEIEINDKIRYCTECGKVQKAVLSSNSPLSTVIWFIVAILILAVLYALVKYVYQLIKGRLDYFEERINYLSDYIEEMERRSASKAKRQEKLNRALREIDTINESPVSEIKTGSAADLYEHGCDFLKSAEAVEELSEAKMFFEKAKNYKDSKQYLLKIKSIIALYDKAVDAFEQAKTFEEYKAASEMFDKLKAFREPREYINRIRAEIRSFEYNNAVETYNNAKTSEECDNAILLFDNLNGYSDSANYIENLKKKSKAAKYSEINDLISNEPSFEKFDKAYEILGDIQQNYPSEADNIIGIKNTLSIKKTNFINKTACDYVKGATSIKDYDKALELFDQIKGQADFGKKNECLDVKKAFSKAMAKFNAAITESEYKSAEKSFRKLDHLEEAREMINKCEEKQLMLLRH